MSKRPSDSAAQPDNPAVVSASCASADSSTWPGWATATRRAARASGGPTGSSSPHLEVAEVDRHPQAPVDEVARAARTAWIGSVNTAYPAEPLGASLRPPSRSAAAASSSSRRANAVSRSHGSDHPAASSRSATTHRPPLDRRAGRDEQAAILIEDPVLEILQLRRRIDPETLGQRDPRAPERPQRLGLAARSVQRQHVHGAQALAPRMLDGQRLQLGDDLAMTAGVQIGLDARLEGGETDLAEPGALAVQGAVGLDVGVRVPAPHRQRRPQHGRRAVGIRHRRRRPVGLLERHAVDLRVRCTSTRRRRPGAR